MKHKIEMLKKLVHMMDERKTHSLKKPSLSIDIVNHDNPEDEELDLLSEKMEHEISPDHDDEGHEDHDRMPGDSEDFLKRLRGK